MATLPLNYLTNSQVKKNLTMCIKPFYTKQDYIGGLRKIDL